MKLIVFGSALTILMPAAKAAFPSYLFFLPIGGSEIAETGIILSVVVAIATLVDTFGSKK